MEDSRALTQLKQELKKEIIVEVVDILRNELEENFEEAFIRRVEEAESRVNQGEAAKYTLEEFRAKF